MTITHRPQQRWWLAGQLFAAWLCAASIVGTALLSSGVAVAAAPPEPPAAPELAEVEKRLADARQRLDEAALELARLHEKVEVTRKTKGGGRAMLGVLIDDPKRRNGVFISGITPGGGAAAAGLRSGDVILAINDEALDGKRGHPHAHISKIMERVRAGDPVSVKFLRNGKEDELEVVTKASGHYMASTAHDKYGGKHDKYDSAHHAKFIEIDMDCFEPEDLLDELSANFGINLLKGDSKSAASVVQLQSVTPHLVDLSPDLAGYFDTQAGVLVLSPAGGLRAGDVIEQVAGERVSSVQDVMERLSGKQGKAKQALQIRRQGKAKTIDVDTALLNSGESRVIRINGPEADIRIELSRTPTGRTNLAP